MLERIPMDRLEFHPWRLSSALDLEDGLDIQAAAMAFDASVDSPAASPLESSIDRTHFLALAGLARAVSRNRIVDASGSFAEADANPRAHELVAMGPVYVHLGLDAHPSPVFRCGIEGAYVQFVESSSASTEARCILVASPDIEPTSTLPAPFDAPDEMLRQQLRLVVLEVRYDRGRSSLPNGCGDPWQDFVLAPLDHVLRAASLHALGRTDAVHVGARKGSPDSWRLNVLSRCEPASLWRARAKPQAVARAETVARSILAKADCTEDVFVRHRMVAMARELMEVCRAAGKDARLSSGMESEVMEVFAASERDWLDHVVLTA